MDFLILKKSLGPGADLVASYRGTERAHPMHFANLPDNHVANQLFFWFVDEGGTRGVVHDLKRAKQLVELLNLFGDTVFFEIVQVEASRALVTGKGGFLGFDVSAAFNPSLVRRILLQEDTEKRLQGADTAAYELSALQRAYFVPRLNDHRLFQSYDDAEFCRKTARALSELVPAWIEGSDLSEYAVTALYKVL